MLHMDNAIFFCYTYGQSNIYMCTLHTDSKTAGGFSVLQNLCVIAEIWQNINEPAHDKTYNKTCATSEDSDQPEHPCSLRWSHLSSQKTCLYNFDPINPHFCIVQLGFTWV